MIIKYPKGRRWKQRPELRLSGKRKQPPLGVDETVPPGMPGRFCHSLKKWPFQIFCNETNITTFSEFQNYRYVERLSKSPKMAILAISHVIKSMTYKHQIHRFRVFRQSLEISQVFRSEDILISEMISAIVCDCPFIAAIS